MRATKLLGFVAVALVGMSASAHADDTTDLQGLLNETIIVGASKSAEAASAAPAVTTTLTSDDIHRYGLHSLDEAIDFLSLGAATSSSLRTVDIGGRGVLLPDDQGDHFLLLINGHAVNEALFGAARFDRGAGIPMELVDHIEVILGPGSVLYGSSAMLGVINVVTKSARTFQGTHLVVESEIGKSWRAAAGGGYEFSLFGQESSVALALEYYKQDGPAFTLGPQNYGVNGVDQRPYNFSRDGHTGIWGGVPAENSYYARVPSGLLTFRTKNLEIDLHASTYKRASPTNYDFVPPDSDFDDPNNYEIDRSVYIDIRHTLPLSAVTQVRTRLYGDSFDYRRFADVSAEGASCTFDVPTCRHVLSGVSRWAGAEIQTSFDWRKDASAVTLLGVDGRVRYVASQVDVLDADTGVPGASTDGVLREHDKVFAAYAQQTWSPVTALGLNAGGRFDFDERFGHRFSPRVAATVQSWRGGTLKAIYSEAFRAPSWEESASAVGTQILANDLRPETVRSVEAALDQKLGSHRLLFGVFRSWWSDLVELHVLTPEEVIQAQAAGNLTFIDQSGTQYRNVSSIDNYGFNAGFEGSVDQNRLHYGFNLTGAIARRMDEATGATPLVVAPSLFGNARIAYDLPGDLPTVALAGRFLGKRPADRAFGAGFVPPPYAPPLAELRATASGPVPAMRGLSYRVSADYSFADRGPYVVGPVQAAVRTENQNTPQAKTTIHAAELNPIDRFRVTVGLAYDF